MPPCGSTIEFVNGHFGWTWFDSNRNADAPADTTPAVRSPASIRAYVEFGKAEATALLAANRARVIAVAAALIERRTLDGAEIDRIAIGSKNR
jgi:ATP-dependent Zn protease